MFGDKQYKLFKLISNVHDVWRQTFEIVTNIGENLMFGEKQLLIISL